MSGAAPHAVRAARERAHYDAHARALDPAAMPPRPPDEWEAAVLASAGPLHGRHVLELGCGDGSLSLALLARGAQLTALDLSPASVALAEARAARWAPDAHGRFLVAPAEATGLPTGAFDLVVGKWVLHHLPLRSAAQEIVRLLAPRGRAVFVETSGLNPVLALARRLLPGRLGVARCGTEDERPLGGRELALLARIFATVDVDFPVFWLAQMVDRHVVQWRSPRFTRGARRLDGALARLLPPVTRYGYWVRVTCAA